MRPECLGNITQEALQSKTKLSGTSGREAPIYASSSSSVGSVFEMEYYHITSHCREVRIDPLMTRDKYCILRYLLRSDITLVKTLV